MRWDGIVFATFSKVLTVVGKILPQGLAKSGKDVFLIGFAAGLVYEKSFQAECFYHTEEVDFMGLLGVKKDLRTRNCRFLLSRVINCGFWRLLIGSSLLRRVNNILLYLLLLRVDSNYRVADFVYCPVIG